MCQTGSHTRPGLLLCIASNDCALAPSLQFCVSDATQIAGALSMPEFEFDDQELLFNDLANAEAVKAAISKLIPFQLDEAA